MKYTNSEWDDVPSLLTSEELVNILRIGPQTIRKMLKAGKIPAVKVGQEWRVNKKDLMEYMGLVPEESKSIGSCVMPSKKHRDKSKARRIQLEIDEDVKDAIKDLSDEMGVSQSQLYQYFAILGLNNIAQARSILPRYLEKSNAPMWEHRINFDRLRKDLDE